ncbi:MAG: C25 family cysteine peptidase, partial [Anaerolineales bacterium]
YTPVTGSVTFSLFPPSDSTCSLSPSYSEVVAAAPYQTSIAQAANTAGVWHWKAHYSGDSNNLPADSGCTAEAVTVNQNIPSLTTSVDPFFATTGAIGVSMTAGDKVTSMGGAFNPNGTVTFTLYSDSTCNTTPVLTSPVLNLSVVGSQPSWSTTWTPSALGTLYWKVHYSGDSNNTAVDSSCGPSVTSEQITVGQASPSITTTANPNTGTVGTAIPTAGDTATFSGAYNPSGLVTFTLYSDATCHTAVTGMSGSGAISGNSASWSSSWTPAAPGTYYWQASYAGDTNNAAFTTTCGAANEQIQVNQANPSITTSASPTSATVGAPASAGDTATFSGGYNPSGSVTFSLYSDATCHTAVTGMSGSGTISSGSATWSNSWTPTALGTYYWQASYAGDSNNSGFTTTCGAANEQIQVNQASPSITTNASPTTGTVGTAISNAGDTATFSGGYNPSGSVTFTLYSDATCHTAVTDMSGSGTISSGSATWSSSWTPTALGTYYWQASYAGDANNAAFTTTCGAANEQITVGQATPTLTTTPSSYVVGSPIYDTAHLNGGYDLTGTLTFDVYAPDDPTCATPIHVIPDATVSGANDYLSGNYAPLEVGTYRWIVTYSGDTNNESVTTNCGDEVTVTPVTLSYFQAQRQGNSVEFVWSTETESGNAGFNLYVKNGNQITKINKDLILSQAIDSLNRLDYTYSARVKGSSFYVEDVSIWGNTLRHGPFQLGKVYGDRLSASQINWVGIHAEFARMTAARQSTLEKGMAAANSGSKESPIRPTPRPTNTPRPTSAPKPTKTPKPTRTPKNFRPTATSLPKETATPTPTGLPKETATPTRVPTDTPTPTLLPTDTLAPTNTLLPTDTLVPTYTLVPTDTPTDTNTPTATATAVPVATPAPTGISFDPSTLQLQSTLNLQVNQTGLYRVSYATLKANGLDLSAYPAAEITVLNRNQMIPVYVYVPNGATNFGPGSYIEFYGTALDTLYSATNIYTVQVSTGAVNHLPGIDASPASGLTAPVSYPYTLVVNNQNQYATSSPSTDPWFDTAMYVDTTSKTWTFNFQVNGLADPTATTQLDLVVWGMDVQPQNPDHHMLVSVNGVSVADDHFNGIVVNELKLTLPGGTLHEGTNTLQLTLPGDTGASWDDIYLDKYSVTYPRLFQAQGSQFSFQSAGQMFNVTGLPAADVVVYRLSAAGLARLDKVQVQGSGNNYTASFTGTSDVATYWISTGENMQTPVLQAAPAPATNLNQKAQYLIIAHPDFIGSSPLGQLVQYHESQGMTVNVVNVEDLYAKYTYGIFDPQAIKQYIAYAAKNLGTKYVLLVGGDTSDYRNYTGANSISFIPSLYTSTNTEAKFVPSDPLYTDLKGDGLPDLPIGRFPVRTVAELNLMVTKTLEYANKNYGGTAVFAADLNDGIVSYKSVSNGLAADLPGTWSSQNVNLDDFMNPDGTLNITAARAQLLAAMNAGPALVTYTGHSGPISWTFSNLFNYQDAQSLTNANKPFVVMQWGCWNTYSVNPQYNFLVQDFLFSTDQNNNPVGAAAVLGASTLVDSNSEQALGNLLTPLMLQPGTTIGQALQTAKSELAQTHPEMLDVLLGWSLMGDPALAIQP